LVEKSYLGRLKGSFYHDSLNIYLFTTLRQAREQGQSWQCDCNRLRPHEVPNFLTPIELRQAAWPLLLTGSF